MALINCPKCSAKISDKASNCPNCGTHITSEFDNIDIYSFSAPQSDKKEIANESQNADTTPSFVKKNKRRLRLLFIICFIAMFAIIVIGLIQNDGKSKDNGIVKHGVCCDAYDYNNDGWVDRIYDRDLQQWWNYQFSPGDLSMDDVE